MNKRFENDGVTLIDNLAKNKTIDVTNVEDAEILVNVLNDLDTGFHEMMKENISLKQQLEFIQNAISTAMQHQKADIGKKALQKVIEEYNEYMLGHKELKHD